MEKFEIITNDNIIEIEAISFGQAELISAKHINPNEIITIEKIIKTDRDGECSHEDSKLNMQNVNSRFSNEDVRNIVLEMQNATMYAHSHMLGRFDTRIELQKVKRKWRL